jgi:Bacterial capsule synthesis protein PGA_cap
VTEIKSRRSLRNAMLFSTGIVVVGLAMISVSSARGQGPAHDDSVVPRKQRDPAKELAMKITAPFTFAAVGDMIIRRPVEVDDPAFQGLLKVMRSADMTYANMEGVIIDPKDPSYHGPHAGGPKSVSTDLKAMGIRVVTTANNHEYDGGAEGIAMTNHLLDEVGIVHAGSGKDLQEAREAQYGITPMGTIGVVGVFPIDPGTIGVARESFAREKWAGVNPLHVTLYNVVTPEQMAELRKIRDASYAHRSEVTTPVAPVPPDEEAKELFLFGTWYKVGDKTGALSYKMDQSDLDGIIRSIRFGKQNSDFMIVAIHCHQNSFSYQAYSHDNSVPDFLVQVAHMAIDNGADVFVGTGVHTLRGVEIYKGKPIFYGVSNYFYQETPVNYITDPVHPKTSGVTYAGEEQEREGDMGNTAGGQHYPDDKEVLLTTSRYEGGKLVEVRLYPGDLGIDGTRPISKAGDPLVPSPEEAQKILKHVQEISRQFGTTISIEDNVGVIRVAQ